MGEIFRSDLVWLDDEFDSKEEFYETIGERLYNKGLVEKDFGEALIKREEVYPTGLKTEAYEIAIPHTDVKYVKEASISFVRFGKPISYSHMGDPEVKVNAKFAFVLGVKVPHQQVEVLSTLVALISDEKEMSKLEKMTSTEEISKELNHFFNERIDLDE
ncbi:MAG: PTS sugar transporter subunit IIA [Anaerostipes sp.]|jgi:PTS system galactitol-specific IIA component|nr:PTS sugar transporter subunit IIA [Anaerostipes sp.]MDD3747550.1 PTS sugar transporter subunit IIA [Anaerostipes sp.]